MDITTHTNPFAAWSSTSSSAPPPHHAFYPEFPPPSIIGALPRVLLTPPDDDPFTFPSSPASSPASASVPWSWSQTACTPAHLSHFHSPSPSPLSSPTLPPTPRTVTFHFASFQDTILNCTVVGPHSNMYYRVSTPRESMATTVTDAGSGAPAGTVDWASASGRPYVEVHGLVPRQRAGRWLALSKDRTYRVMPVDALPYTWTPMQADLVCALLLPEDAPYFGRARPVARITKTHNMAALALGVDAIAGGLLPACVLAAVLLLSGRNID